MVDKIVADKLTEKVTLMYSTFKKLVEKVKLFEERLVKVETEQEKDCVLTKPLKDQTINMNNTYNILEEMISTNKESLTKIEDDLKLIKNNKKDESSRQSFPKESKIKRCNFFNRGYCKFKENCPLFHPKEICSEKQCLNKECMKRHIRECKNWAKGSF